MSVLFGHHEDFSLHEPGWGHPERPERLLAVVDGLRAAGLDEALTEFAPRAATLEELARVHDPGVVSGVEELAATGGAFDPDTLVGPGSFEAARRAAGAGLEAVERLDRGEGSAAFLALRPPGHHAMPHRPMGFCLFNNVAVTAAALLERGDRVLVLDWDAHHGNGTQAAFYDRPDLLFFSLHQYPAYPGTGALEETGTGEGAGTTMNVPFPAGTMGDAYRLAFDELLVPAAEAFSPSWLLVSAGFDAHRADPLTELGLTAGDFADLTERALRLAPPGRRILFLEGGYDLEALSASVGASVSALVGERWVPEPRSAGGPDGRLGSGEGGLPAELVRRALALHERLSLA